MDYEEQLSAAKFRAERDQARQEVKELRGELDAIKAEREYDVKALNHRIAEMEPRLMPEGCEWPRYESGERVELGDEVVGPDYGESIHADEITFHANGFTVREKTGLDHWYESDARFKHPAVIAADGEPLEVGQTVWEVDGTGHAFEVVGIRPDTGRAMEPTVVTCDVGDGTSEHFLPSQLTHQRPVLDADGVPIKEGDTVHELGKRRPIIVDLVDYVDRKASGFCANTGARVYNLRPENLTHEAQPDSIEALAGDLAALAERAKGSVMYREIAALAARARNLAGVE